MRKLVYGVGINDGKYPAYIDGKVQKEYMYWKDMLRRCYDEKVMAKHPTYIGCYASDNFKSYSYFYEWCKDQIGFDTGGYHLDKDILIKGNKIYSERTCFFVPPELNSVLTSCTNARGDSPIGVTKRWSNFNGGYYYYVSRMSIQKKRVFIGNYKTEIEAFLAYKEAKECYLKKIAEKYKESIDPLIYQSLINYNVEITD